MAGYTGNDGSELAGGLTPGGTIKALSVDNSGNLNVNASVSSGPTNITQINSAAVSASNGLPVSGNNGGSLVVLDVDSSGRLYVNVNSLPALVAGSALIGGVELYDSSGVNKLAIDASGRLTLVPNSSVNVAQIGGATPQIDNSHELGVSLYGKGNGAAGDTALLLDALGQMTIEQFVQYQIMAGHGFMATTGYLAVGANNAFVALQMAANSISKNVLVYSILIGNGAGLETDGRIYMANVATADTNLTTTLTAGNMQANSATTSALTTLACSPANTTQTSGFVGTNSTTWLATANTQLELLAPSKFLFIAKSSAGSIEIAQKKSTSTNSALISVFWVEW